MEQQKSAYQRAQETKVNTVEGNTPSSYMGKSRKDDTAEVTVTPIPFDSTTEARLTTTIELSSLVNTVFNKVFRDYYGCILVLDPVTNRWKADLYFSENANASEEAAIKNLEPIAAKFGNGVGANGARRTMGSMAEGFTARTSNIHYELSTVTKEALTKYYMPWELKKGEPNWKKIVTEQYEQANYGYNSSTIYICVHGVDIVKILTDIYGNKNEENHYVDYAVTAIRPLSQIQPNSNSNMLLNVQRIDQFHVEELCRKIGAIPSHGRLPIIR